MTRTHHADEYEMKTVMKPETIMAVMMLLREEGGKLRDRFSGDQSSISREAARRMGMVRRLL